MTIDSRGETQFFRKCLQGVPHGVLVADERGQIAFANDAFGTLLDEEPEELRGGSVADVCQRLGLESTPTEFRERVGPDFDSATETSVRRDGTVLTCSFSETTHDGTNYAIITARTQETERQAPADDREELFRKAFEESRDAIVVFDPVEEEMIECNARACEMLGYTHAELLSTRPADIHPHESDRFEGFVERVVEDGRGWTDELSCHTCDGDVIPAEVSAARVTVSGRSCVLASIRDVSQQKRYVARLEALNEVTRSLMTADSVTAVAGETLDCVGRVLPEALSGVWKFDPEANHLSPVEVRGSGADRPTPDGTESGVPVIEAGTAEMEVFDTGEPRFIRDYEAVTDPAHQNLALVSRCVIPLGGHGLLTVGVTGDRDDLSGSVRDLLRIAAGSAESALDRLENEREIRRRSAAMEAANSGIAITDDELGFEHANVAFGELFGYEDGETILGTHWHDVLDADSVERIERARSTAVETGSWQGELTGVDLEGQEVDLSVVMTELDDGGFVVICVDISTQKLQQQRLKALNELSQELLQAETEAEIAQLAIETITDTLPQDIVVIQKFDPEANALTFEEMSDEADALLESHPTYDLESTYAGTAYRDSEVIIRTGSTDESSLGYLEHQSLHAPLRDYGTLSILNERDSGFDEELIEFINVTALNLGIALERVDREQQLREQRNELTQRNRLNETTRNVIQSLVEAATRDEIESAICESLTDSSRYEYAWIADVDTKTEEVTPRASAGVETETLRAISGVDLFEPERDPVVEAIRSGTIERVHQYRLAEQEVTTESGSYPGTHERVEVTVVVPLAYGSRTYGALVIGTGRSNTLEEGITETFELLGETAGFAINAVQNRQILLSNRVTELKFEARDEMHLVVAVSDLLDCRCRLEFAEPTSDGTVRYHLRVRDFEPEPSTDDIERLDHVEQVTVLTRSEDELLLEIVHGEPVARELGHTGANVREVIGERGVAEVTLEVPQNVDIRDVVNQYRALYPNSELVAKRHRERSGNSTGEFRNTIEQQLTQRQLSMLEDAYEAGYFSWPRENTAEEVADQIGISSPTLHQHLRMAERKILSTLFDDEG